MTVGSVVVILVCTSMFAWYITRVKSTATKLLYLLCVFSMVVPFQMVMFTLSLVTDRLRLGTPWGLIIIYLGFGAGLAVFMFCGFVKSIPIEIEEAAMIDGGSQWVILLKVFLPVVKPTLAAVTLFTIVGHWNDYFSALVYITDTANYPLQTYIQQLNVDITEVTDPDKLEQLARISSRTLNSAKIVVSTIPLLMIYPFMQKYFVSGIVVGSVKE